MDSTNGWTENKKLVLHRLEDTEYAVREIRKRIEKLERQMAVHAAQTRMAAGVIGAVAGLIPAVLSIVFSRL
tara:strand:- start:392 stop:607 length:216 start_codon:yes stop_codon:yes gene_type:complete